MTNIDQNAAECKQVPDPAQFEPFIERLMVPAAGYGGKFIVYGIRENPATGKGQIKVEHVANSGEPVFIAAALASAVRRICAIPGMNCYVNACLMRADLPEKQRGKKADVIGVFAIPLDFDKQHSPATRAERLPFDPHLEVETSPGNFQSWPILDHLCSLAEAEAVAAALCAKVGVDATASGEHGYRVPGTLNYPNAKKRKAGRPPEPVMARISIFADPSFEPTSISLDALRHAILAKYPDAFDAQEKKAEKEVDFDWEQRAAALRLFSDDEIDSLWNDPKIGNDRSAAAWAVFCAATRRGYSPAETLELSLDNLDTMVGEKYKDKTDAEGALRSEIKKAFLEVVADLRTEKAARDTFEHVKPEQGSASPGLAAGPSIATDQTSAEADGRELLFMKPADLMVREIEWIDMGANGFIKPTAANTRLALLTCGFKCGFDSFRGFPVIGGEPLNNWQGDLTDEITIRLCHFIKRLFGFEPEPQKMKLAMEQLSYENKYNPVTDYLDGLTWDGVARIDTWTRDHFGTPDTLLNRAIGRIILLAAVRRARQPGCKFDEIAVLESKEGWNKSSALQLMAGEKYFSDQSLLKENEKTQAEHLRGKWIYEIADLSGINKADRDHVKAMASRQIDRTRRVWGFFELDQRRTCILTATTNDSDYLEGDTGHRRFWPVTVTKIIDLKELAAVRDQLWAEAAHREKQGESIRLDQSLWGDAAEEQEARRLSHPWEDTLARVKGVHCEAALSLATSDYVHNSHEERVYSTTLLTGYLKIEISKQTQYHGKTVKRIMQSLGWNHSKNIHINGEQGKGFWRIVEGPMPKPTTADALDLDAAIPF